MEHREDEVEWIRRSRSGEADAFGPLVERYEQMVHALAYRLTGSLAEEMKNRELDAWLRSAAPPVRSDAARKEFVDAVLRRIRRGEESPWTVSRAGVGRWFWVWVPASVALLGLLTLLVLSHFFHTPPPGATLAAPAALWRELARTFPQMLLAVIIENGDTRLVLGEGPKSAPGDPVYVRLTGGKVPCSVIALSGGSVEADGVRFEVLADATGQVWLIGENAVWSSAEPSRPFAHLTVEARRLEGVL